MLFTKVATGRMNCRGEKKVTLEDSGRVILSWRGERKSHSKRQNWFVARVCNMGRRDMLSSGA